MSAMLRASVQNGVSMIQSSPRPMADPASGLRAASPAMHRLELARGAVEKRFLAAGEVLALAVGGVGQLIGSLDNLAGALDPQTVEATRTELNSAARSLFDLRERLEGRRLKTRGLSRLVDGLRAGIEDMRRDLAYLRVFSINIKVTAAGIPGAGEDFALFAQEISDRIESGRVELERFASEVSVLHDQLNAALVQEQALGGECERLIPSVPDGLAASAHDISAHHEKVARVAAEVRELAQDIQRKVGAALAALQVGDSTRQRIEHVQNGLAKIAAACPEPETQARMSAVVGPVLSAQLGAAAADFHRDAAQIHQSMAGIATHARELLRLKDLAFGRSAANEGFLDRMTVHLDQALGLVGRMEGADSVAAQTGRSAVAAVEALSRRIAALQSIKTDVQQMALNTTLKCARIGETGKPLSVIAIELRVHAGLLEGSAQRTLVTLDELAVEAARMAEDGTGASAGSALTAATGRMRKANTAVEADLAALAQQGEAVVRALGDAATRLDFHGEIGAALDAAAALLDQPPGDPTAVDPALLAEILQTIAKSYTMKQEREVHAALTAGFDLAAPAQSAEPEQAVRNELEAVLF
jgi:hypothetical protein